MKNSKQGFTLIELLVVVLIIGVLAAIALPMYQKAVMRSRFNALMPIAKAMSDANEAYYLEHNNYASNPQDLLVQGKTEYPTGTELSFGENMEHAYVLASNPSVKNNYIVYQKHSENYPGEIHCEALEEDAQAEYICESAGATQNIGKTITDGYTTYVLSGEGFGFPPGYDVPTCDAATAMGLTCSITTNDDGQTIKQVCKNGFCRTKTFNEDGSYTSLTCQVNSENRCISRVKSITYDTNGNKLKERYCSNFNNNTGNCISYGSGRDYTYDANGNMLTSRGCNSFDGSGNCTQYASSKTEYTYDANGNQLTSRYCSSVDGSGNCTAYSNSDAYDYTYDANGHKLTERYCKTVDNNGTCTAYDANYSYDYTYDANGNMLTSRSCNSFDGSGNCTQYGEYNSYDYAYDANGNQLSERRCSNMDSSGNCGTYGSGWNYTYDANGNELTRLSCGHFDNSGNCTQYNSTGYNYTYDANGNRLTEWQCEGFDNSGTCTEYRSRTDYTYDDNGKEIAVQRCYDSGINKATGECYTYNTNSIGTYAY